MPTLKHIVLGVTGSVAAYKAADLVRRLKEQNFKVTVVMTREAKEFVTPLTFAALTGEKVYSDIFENKNDGEDMPHIFLARQADLILVAPATANVIGKIANGLADDLLTNMILAAEVPIALAPAMNQAMYKNVFVQANSSKLKSAGFYWIEPTEGLLACGEFGAGHLACVEDIVNAVQKILK